MTKAQRASRARKRLTRHRTRLTASGSSRVEVTVPTGDAPLLKALAAALRAGGDDAARVRDSLDKMVSRPAARTGAELVAFLRTSPLAGERVDFERDRSPGRPIDLE